MLSDDDDIPADDAPRDRFDILFDQIMGISGKSSRPQKSARSRRQKRSRDFDPR